MTNEIAYQNECLQYYEDVFFRTIFSDIQLLTLIRLSPERTKIDFLKSEYKKFLGDKKIEILASHFKNFRTFKPNHLESSLLRHKIDYLVPDYQSFKTWADRPTKRMALFLESRIRRIAAPIEETIAKPLDDLKAFIDMTYEKYHQTKVGGWHTEIEEPDLEVQKKELAMTIYLMDEKKYGG